MKPNSESPKFTHCQTERVVAVRPRSVGHVQSWTTRMLGSWARKPFTVYLYIHCFLCSVLPNRQRPRGRPVRQAKCLMNCLHHNYESQQITYCRLWIWRRWKYKTRVLPLMGALLPFVISERSEWDNSKHNGRALLTEVSRLSFQQQQQEVCTDRKWPYTSYWLFCHKLSDYASCIQCYCFLHCNIYI